MITAAVRITPLTFTLQGTHARPGFLHDKLVPAVLLAWNTSYLARSASVNSVTEMSQDSVIPEERPGTVDCGCLDVRAGQATCIRLYRPPIPLVVQASALGVRSCQSLV